MSADYKWELTAPVKASGASGSLKAASKALRCAMAELLARLCPTCHGATRRVRARGHWIAVCLTDPKGHGGFLDDGRRRTADVQAAVAAGEIAYRGLVRWRLDSSGRLADIAVPVLDTTRRMISPAC